MNEKLRIPKFWLNVLLAWNVVVLIGFTIMSLYVWVLAPLAAPARMTDLDRAQVINEQKLKERFPHLADDIRHDLGMWVARWERAAAIRSSISAAIVIGINVLLLVILRIRFL